MININMGSIVHRIDWLLVAAVGLTLPILLMTSLLDGQMPGTTDAELHLHRFVASANNFDEGVFWQRWYPTLFFGYGYPVGNYYPPLVNILGGGLTYIGIPAVTALLLVQSLALILHATGGYLFARLFADRPSALFAAALYLYTPFHFFHLFVMGNIPQFFAVGLSTWALWAFGKCALRPSPARIAIAAVLFAAITLSHHVVAYFMIPFLGGYAVLAAIAVCGSYILKPRYRAHLIAPLAAYGLGLLLTTIFWLPALAEIEYIVPLEESAQTYANIRENFVQFKELVGPLRPPDRAALIPIRTLNVGQIQLLVMGVGFLGAIIFFRKLGTWERIHLFVFPILAAGTIYLMTYQSLWVWQFIPNGELIQNPWRILVITTLMSIPAAALVMQSIPSRWRTIALVVGIVAVIAVMLPLSYPQVENRPISGDLTPADTIQYERVVGNQGTVAFAEYMPKWVAAPDSLQPPICGTCYDQWRWQIDPLENSLADGITVDISDGEKTRGTHYQVQSEQSFDLTLHQLYFPGWRATLDGEAWEIDVTDTQGLMTLKSIPAGQHQIELWYAGTPLQTSADALTLFALFICMALFVAEWRQHQHRSTYNVQLPAAERQLPSSRFSERSLALIVIVGSSLFGLINYTYIEPETDWFRSTGTVTEPLYMDEPLNTVFLDASNTPQIELLGYSMSHDDRVHYGDWVFIDLYWRALRPLSQEWRLRLDFTDTVTGQAWLGRDIANPGIVLTTGWTTDKYVVDRHILRFDDTVPPYVGNFVVQLYSLQTGEILHLENNEIWALLKAIRVDEQGSEAMSESAETVQVQFGDFATLRGFNIQEQGDNQQQVQLYWHVEQETTHDYNLFIHYWQGDAFLEAADQPPIEIYPTHLWDEGQYLQSTFMLSPPQNADRVIIGFYDRISNQRLKVSGDSSLVESDGFVLELDQ